jgi:hypothetical protein
VANQAWPVIGDSFFRAHEATGEEENHSRPVVEAAPAITRIGPADAPYSVRSATMGSSREAMTAG